MAEIYLRPNGDITVGLSCSAGSNHYELVDEDTLNIADYVYKTSNAGDANPASASDLLSLETYTLAAGESVKSITAWFYLGTSDTGASKHSYTIKLYKGTTELATATTTDSGWQSITYTGTLTQSEIDDLRVYVLLSATSVYNYGTKAYDQYSSYCYMIYCRALINQTLAPGSITTTAAVSSLSLSFGIRIDNHGDPFTITFPAVWLGDIQSTLAFGSPTLSITTTTQTLIPDGIASTISAGTPMVVHLIAPQGIASATAFGTPALVYDQTLLPGSIESTTTFGQALTNLDMLLTGIGSTASFGTPALGFVLFATGIGSTELVGEPNVGVQQWLLPGSIVLSTTFGTDIHFWHVECIDLGVVEFPFTFPFVFPPGLTTIVYQGQTVTVRYRRPLVAHVEALDSVTTEAK